MQFAAVISKTLAFSTSSQVWLDFASPCLLVQFQGKLHEVVPSTYETRQLS
jgi:hypothetical protein